MKIVEAKVNGSELSIRVTASRLEASTAAGFKKDCQDAWQPKITSVVADLSQVQFIDSSGVGALLSLYKRLPAPNPCVNLIRVQPPVRAVIELLRLHRIFVIET